MKHYRHLTQEQRCQISILLKTTISQNEIARIIGVDKSTISREIKQNKGKRGYRPKQVHHSPAEDSQEKTLDLQRVVVENGK